MSGEMMAKTLGGVLLRNPPGLVPLAEHAQELETAVGAARVSRSRVA